MSHFSTVLQERNAHNRSLNSCFQSVSNSETIPEIFQSGECDASFRNTHRGPIYSSLLDGNSTNQLNEHRREVHAKIERICWRLQILKKNLTRDWNEFQATDWRFNCNVVSGVLKDF